VLSGDADAAVAHHNLTTAVGMTQPGQVDLAAVRRVAHGVVGQVGHGAEQFGLQPGNLDRFRHVSEGQAVPAA